MTLDALRKAGVNVLAWGNFVSIVVNFIILAFIVFVMMKWLASLKQADKKVQATAEVVVSEDIALLREIRDALKRQ